MRQRVPPQAIGMTGSTQLRSTFSSWDPVSSLDSSAQEHQVKRAMDLRAHLTVITWLPGDRELMHRLLQESFTLYQYATSHQEIVGGCPESRHCHSPPTSHGRVQHGLRTGFASVETRFTIVFARDAGSYCASRRNPRRFGGHGLRVPRGPCDSHAGRGDRHHVAARILDCAGRRRA